MKYRYRRVIIGLMGLVSLMGLMGCTDQDATRIVEKPVDVAFAFSVPTLTDIGLDVTPTRMADSVVQISNQYYRDMQDVIIIPFKTSGKITYDDMPSQHLSYSTWAIYQKSNGRFYYNRKCQFVPGVSSVLLYGRGDYSVMVDGAPIPGENRHYYGSTMADIPSDLSPSSITFAPTQIRTTIDSDEKAEALADYLTSIAKTPGWSTTTDAKLKALYINYIGKKENSIDYRIFAGSSQSVLAYLNELYKEVGLYESDASLATAIRASIAEKSTVTAAGVTSLVPELSGYPGNIDLPDGAAAMQWISGEDRFVPQTTTTTIAPITSVTRFAYPAELYYYANSLISTSSREILPSLYASETLWNSVLQNYNGGVVDRQTKSVAVNSPIQYGVACLSTTLNATPETLTDGDGVKFGYNSDWNDDSFPLTAVIVGGQYPVGFDFRPETYAATPSEADMRYVYDTQVKTRRAGSTTDYYYLGPTAQTGRTNTLVLQSYENLKVIVVLEFENRCGKKFKGKDCIVYPGSKFYLIGFVDPTVKSGSADYYKRVFTQDYVTTLDMTVSPNCLANAYSVMPDLLASRLEIGVLLVPNWDVITPTNVELF